MGIKKQIGLAAAATMLGASLIGAGTYAIFSSTATNSDNTFGSGTLTVSMDKPEGNKYFNIANMAPGDSGEQIITVTNGGSLDLRYDVTAAATGALLNGSDTAKGSKGLILTYESSTDGTNWTPFTPGDNNFVLDATADPTVTGGSATMQIKVKYDFPKDTVQPDQNFYQNKTADLDLTVTAEQVRNN